MLYKNNPSLWIRNRPDRNVRIATAQTEGLFILDRKRPDQNVRIADNHARADGLVKQVSVDKQG